MTRKPRKATPKSLENAALHYLERFATSSENLRRVLLRRVRRSAEHHGTDPDEGMAWVDDLISRFRKSGLLDDRLYTEGRVASLRRRGDAARKVRGKLRQKDVDADLIEAVLGEEDENAEFLAATTLARRRRLGPWRADDDQRKERREKDLAALARAGFSYDTALLIIDAESVEDLE